MAEQRIPPHSMEAEQSVLGSMMLDPNAVITAMETLSPEDFYSQGHREIFQAMCELYAAARPVDIVTVMDMLEQRGTLERAGGMEYLNELSRMVPTTSNVSNYVSIVEDRAVLREIIHAGSDMVNTGFAANQPSDDVVNAAHDAIFKIATRKKTDTLRPISESLIEAYDQISEAAQSKGGVTGTPSGFADLDALTSGFHPGQLIVLAARPGKGKTSFALNMAYHAAVRQNIPVAIFSLEMSSADIATRLMCSSARVSMSAARSGRLTDEEMNRLVLSMREFRGENGQSDLFYVDDSGGITVQDIRAKCMRRCAEQQLGLIVIDYLQLISTPNRRNEGRQQEISELTRSLKLMARDVGAPVILLSQLNRDIERRQDKRPMLADLRESGSIEQDADMVIFLAHESDLNDSEGYDEEEEQGTQNGALAILAKNRNGPTGDVELVWLSEYTTFVGASNRQD